MHKKRLAIIFIAACACSYLFFHNSCSKTHSIELRAAIDIGSGATKIKIAEVDVKTQKIASVIFEDQIAVAFQTQLSRSPDETFDGTIMQEGIVAIQQLKEIADQHDVKKVVAVATAAFRQAKNADAYARQITEETGVEVHIIDQEKEGILAFNAAMANTETDSSQAVVWDIGGGSQQLTIKDENDEYYVCKGEIASISFRDHIIENLQGHNVKLRSTPNPIAGHVARQAVDYAQLIGQRIDPSIQTKANDSETTIFAVGSLFGYGIKSLVGDQTIVTQDLLQKAIDSLIDLDDENLQGGEFANVTVSNALLVLGTMKGLNIEKIVIQDVNNADGVLVLSDFYHSENS
jgi:exopolyphosphatase/guanosine-5'-triphosphate,3'-diphosphate pyrophosphatase